MLNRTKWIRVGVGAVAAVALVAALAAWVPATTSAHGGSGAVGGIQNDTALAAALGISADKLTAAEQKVAADKLAKAVADGKLTQAQADQMGQGGLRGPGPMIGGVDGEAKLAAALGVSADTLRAARDKVFQSQLSAAVSAGRLTQAQADDVRAQHALQSYFEAQGIPDKARAVYEQAAKDAVKAGVITQQQADKFLNGGNLGGPGGFGGPGGPGMFGDHGMRGGPHGGGGFGRQAVPAQPSTPAQPGAVVPGQTAPSNL